MVTKIVHEKIRFFTDRKVEEPYAEFKQWHPKPELVEMQIIQNRVPGFPVAILAVGLKVWHVRELEHTFGYEYLIELQGKSDLFHADRPQCQTLR